MTKQDLGKLTCSRCGKELQDIGKLLGRRGGLTTKKKYGKAHYVEIGKKGMKSRWGKT